MLMVVATVMTAVAVTLMNPMLFRFRSTRMRAREGNSLFFRQTGSCACPFKGASYALVFGQFHVF